MADAKTVDATAAAAAAKGFAATKPAETKQFRLHHSMIRVADIEKSVDFYANTLGMTLVHTLDFPQWKFSLYFFKYLEDDETLPQGSEERMKYLWRTKGYVELTYNYEVADDFTGYCNGNKEPHKGFGHLAITVPNLKEACKRFDELGVKFQKRPEQGNMNNIAFILDPDEYWIEVIQQKWSE
jgi:lactoylglutathione lyase